MNKIRIPIKRAYYTASRKEQDDLLCWIPSQEFARMVQDGHIPQELADDYPGGIEVRVSASAFDEFEVDLGVTPDDISEAYKTLRTQGRLPESGIVDGVALENLAQGPPRVAPEAAPDWGPTAPRPRLSEPEWTDGDDAATVMSNLE